jgi:cytidylate kinase
MAVPGKIKELVERAAKRYECESRARIETAGFAQPVKVITISRTLGSGGRAIAELLGGLLNCAVWDREILDVMADQAEGDVQGRMFEALDEIAHNEIEAMLTSMAGSVDRRAYQYLLPRSIHIIARNDAVIVGRGAHLILPNAFKVCVKAPMEARLARLKERTGWSDAEAVKRIEQADRSRVSFLREMAQITRRNQPGDPYRQVDFDLEISTNRFTVEEASEVIMTAAAKHFMRSGQV